MPNVKLGALPATRVRDRDKAEQDKSPHLCVSYCRVLSVSYVWIDRASQITTDIGGYIGNRCVLNYVDHEHVLLVSPRLGPVSQKK